METNNLKAKLRMASLIKADGTKTVYYFGSCVVAMRFAKKHGYILESFAGFNLRTR